MLKLVVAAKVIPHATGVAIAGGLAAAQASGGDNSAISVALVGGIFLLLNTIITLVLNRILNGKDDKNSKNSSGRPNRYPPNRARSPSSSSSNRKRRKGKR